LNVNHNFFDKEITIYLPKTPESKNNKAKELNSTTSLLVFLSPVFF